MTNLFHDYDKYVSFLLHHVVYVITQNIESRKQMVWIHMDSYGPLLSLLAQNFKKRAFDSFRAFNIVKFPLKWVLNCIEQIWGTCKWQSEISSIFRLSRSLAVHAKWNYFIVVSLCRSWSYGSLRLQD